MWIPHRDNINNNKHYHYNTYTYNVGGDHIANNTKAEEPGDIRNIVELLKGLKTLTIFKS
jgi:predicted transcriptional regulator